MGFALPARITAAAVRSYRTFSPLPDSFLPGGIVFCGTFRKIRFERIPPAVSRHVALWRPDFPPARLGCPARGQRLPVRQARIHYGGSDRGGAIRYGYYWACPLQIVGNDETYSCGGASARVGVFWRFDPQSADGDRRLARIARISPGPHDAPGVSQKVTGGDPDFQTFGRFFRSTITYSQPIRARP